MCLDFRRELLIQSENVLTSKGLTNESPNATLHPLHFQPRRYSSYALTSAYPCHLECGEAAAIPARALSCLSSLQEALRNKPPITPVQAGKEGSTCSRLLHTAVTSSIEAVAATSWDSPKFPSLHTLPSVLPSLLPHLSVQLTHPNRCHLVSYPIFHTQYHGSSFVSTSTSLHLISPLIS